MTPALRQLPNLLTIGRGLAGPAGAWLLLMSASADMEAAALTYGLASGLVLVLAALSDGLDGWLARRLGAESAFGALWDPIADKLLVGAYLVAYLVIARFDTWLLLPVLVIVLRDLVLTGLRLRSAEPAAFAVSPEAKLKTALQMVVVLAPFAIVLAGFRDVAAWFYLWVGAVWFVAVLAIWTALPHLRAARRS